MTAKIGQKFRLTDHVSAVHTGDKIEPLASGVAEVVLGKLLQLRVAAAENGVVLGCGKFELRQKWQAEGVLIEPAPEQRSDLPVGLLRLAAAGSDLIQPHFIQSAADPLNRLRVAKERGSIPTKERNIRIFDRKEIELEQVLQQLLIIPGLKCGFDMMPSGLIEVPDHIRCERIDRKQFV